MSLHRNSLLRHKRTGETHRVVYVDNHNDLFWHINANRSLRSAKFFSSKLSEVVESLKFDDAMYEVVIGEGTGPSKISDIRGERRNSRFRLIEPIVSRVPECFGEEALDALIKVRARDTGEQEGRLRTWVLNYFKGGANRNALLDNFHKCGTVSSLKPGKRRGHASSESKYVWNDEDKLSFRDYFKLHYKNTDRRKFAKVFRDWRDERFKWVDAETQEIHLFGFADKPTLNQAYRLYDQQSDDIETDQARAGPGWAKSSRAQTGDPMKGVSGPGTFQIDATIGDIYLVSMVDKREVVGRPLVYLIVDVFSRCIVGFHVSLGNASYIEAMATMYSTVQDRSKMAELFDMPDFDDSFIGPPIQGTSIVGDNGEMSGYLPPGFYNELGMTIVTCPSYRPDLKGCVEGSFGWIKGELEDTTIGWVKPDFRERGAPDYKEDATLNLMQFIRRLARGIKIHNHRPLADYHLTLDMVNDGVQKVPMQLLEWGIRKRSGSLQPVSPDTVFFALMPRAKATVRSTGFRFKENDYTCEEAIAGQWFARARKSEYSIDISYDPRNCSCVFVHSKTSPTGYVIATLHDRHSDRASLPFDEIDALNDRSNPTAEARLHGDEVRANQKAKQKQEQDLAKAEKAALGKDPRSKKAQFADIRKKRSKEHTAIGAVQSPIDHLRPDTSAPKAEVLQFPVRHDPSDFPVKPSVPFLSNLLAKVRNENT